jgi:hypothetical protein
VAKAGSIAIFGSKQQEVRDKQRNHPVNNSSFE